MLRPANDRAYERILLMGGPGAGKTHAGLKIAKLAHKTGSDARFYIVDTDFAVDRMLSGEEFSGLENVEHRVVDDWPELVGAVDLFRKAVRPQDWLMVDMLSFAWESVQSFYTEQIFGADVGDFFLAARKADKDHEFDGWTDWKVINKLYQGLTAKLLRLQGHLLCTCPVDNLPAPPKRGTDPVEKSVRAMYGKFGVKPRGQKHTGHLFHTVIWLTQGSDGWRATSVKDRERRLLEGEQVKNFPLDYLVRVGGWRP